jgi:SAM-dependent methyltransferase
MAQTGPPVVTGREDLGRAGFSTGADVYESARPSYPDAAVAHMERTAGIAAGSRVLDLAAGTGKMTRQLVAGGAVCIGVEPSAAMREVFARTVPGVAVAAGTAERLPFAASSMDAVVVAQAFHWLDPARALPEIVRVLRSRGWLALIWNERDGTDPAMAELARISKWPFTAGADSRPVLDVSGLFGPVERTRFPFVRHVDLTVFVDDVASRSYVRVLPDDQRKALLEEVAAFGSTLEQPIAMPYVTDLFCAQARS